MLSMLCRDDYMNDATANIDDEVMIMRVVMSYRSEHSPSLALMPNELAGPKYMHTAGCWPAGIKNRGNKAIAP